MTDQTNAQVAQNTENKLSDKELNFRALEAKYQRELQQERQARIEAEVQARKLSEMTNVNSENENDDSEPYVDHKVLNKKLDKFNKSTQTEIQKAMEMAKQAAKEEIKRETWLENHPDFYNVLQHAEKFAQKSPKLAETILRMPEGFERQMLVYENIKEMGIDKPEQKQASIQEKVDANKRSPYYQPSGVGAAPYGFNGDFSPGGQKSAYDKMKELQARLRI